MKYFEELERDLKAASDCELPRDYKAASEKLKVERIHHGMRVLWYYREDEDFHKREKIEPRDYAGYSGIIVAAPDKHACSNMDIEDCVVIVHRYPADKHECETDYVALARLLDNDELVEVFEDRRAK